MIFHLKADQSLGSLPELSTLKQNQKAINIFRIKFLTFQLGSFHITSLQATAAAAATDPV